MSRVTYNRHEFPVDFPHEFSTCFHVYLYMPGTCDTVHGSDIFDIFDTHFVVSGSEWGGHVHNHEWFGDTILRVTGPSGYNITRKSEVNPAVTIFESPTFYIVALYRISDGSTDSPN